MLADVAAARTAQLQLGARIRHAPESAEFILVLEELGQLAEEGLEKLVGRHRRAVLVPEAGHHHVLNHPGLAVCESDEERRRCHLHHASPHQPPSTTLTNAKRL
jgi:hypothetical protein